MLCGPGAIADAHTDHEKIGKRELRVDHGDIVDRVDPIGDMDHVRVLEAPDDMRNRIGFPDIGKELVAVKLPFHA